MTVNVGRDGRIVFAGGNLVKGLSAGATPAALDATDAVEAAAKALGLDEPTRCGDERLARRRRVLSGGGISASPIDAKLGWHAAADGKLRLAWRVVIDAVVRLAPVERDGRRAHRRAAGLRGPDRARRHG